LTDKSGNLVEGNKTDVGGHLIGPRLSKVFEYSILVKSRMIMFSFISGLKQTVQIDKHAYSPNFPKLEYRNVCEYC
jgi:amino acid permease